MKKCSLLIALGAFASLATAASAQNAPARPKDGWPSVYSLTAAKNAAPLAITSSAVKSGEAVPLQHTAFGKNVSPPLSWSKGPEGTRSYVFILEDPDGGAGPFPVFHWVVYDIPAATQSLPPEVPAQPELSEPKGAKQGLNNRSEFGYRGPRAPAGETHRYLFQVYALDTTLGLDPKSANRKAVVDGMQGHVLAKGSLVAPTTGR
ncbi:MAG: YbhB/YbcL family Raf kinase inhibitor-like protein [Gemmatimonas sp.]